MFARVPTINFQGCSQRVSGMSVTCNRSSGKIGNDVQGRLPEISGGKGLRTFFSVVGEDTHNRFQFPGEEGGEDMLKLGS